MKDSKFKVFATRDTFFGDAISIRIGYVRGDWVAIVEPPALRELKENELGMEHPPALTLSRDDAQQFMDELWHVGIRPTEGTGSVGSLAATERHLADMRALVFKTGAPK